MKKTPLYACMADDNMRFYPSWKRIMFPSAIYIYGGEQIYLCSAEEIYLVQYNNLLGHWSRAASWFIYVLYVHIYVRKYIK